MNLAEPLLAALKAYGAGEIFGIPGDFALPFFREIDRTNVLPLYTLSHEPAVGFAADAAARHRGTLGVVAVTYGAGALNMVNAVATAYAEKSPLVVISGAPGAAEGTMGLGLHHQVKHLDSQRLVYNEVTCAQAVLNDAETAPKEIAQVLTTAREHVLPVYIELPRDMVTVACAAVPAYIPAPSDRKAARACANEVMELLSRAKAPVLMLGVEIRRYGLKKKVYKLARRLGIPAVTSFMGRGILAETGSPFAGTYLGLAGEASVRKLVERSDGLLMLGVIMCDTNFGVSKRQIDMRHAAYAFNREVRFNHHVYPHMPLAALVDELLKVAKPLGKAKPAKWTAPRRLNKGAGSIKPLDVAVAVNNLFARHGTMLIASDTGDCLFTAMDMQHTPMVAPGFYATMGPGVPFGLGLQAASGLRPIILVGDGAFQMTGLELGNCRRLGLNPIVLVFNNAAWGMLKTFQPDTGYNDLDDWNFAALADAIGGKGVRVTTRGELAEALEAAYDDESSFQLIDIIIPREEISPTLARFVEAIRRRSVLANTG